MDIREKLDPRTVESIIEENAMPFSVFKTSIPSVDSFSYVNDSESMMDYTIIYYHDNKEVVKVVTRYRVDGKMFTPLYNQVNMPECLFAVTKHDDETDFGYHIFASVCGEEDSFDIFDGNPIYPIYTLEQYNEVKMHKGFLFRQSSKEKNDTHVLKKIK